MTDAEKAWWRGMLIGIGLIVAAIAVVAVGLAATDPRLMFGCLVVALIAGITGITVGFKARRPY